MQEKELTTFASVHTILYGQMNDSNVELWRKKCAMKKKWIRFLSLILALALTGCGNPVSTTSMTPEATETPSINETDDTNIIEEDSGTETTETEIDEFAQLLEEEEQRLSAEQLNSVAMLYYLATVTQEISSAKNNRMYLETAYSSLINNTNPENVNELTESHMSSLLDIIEKYRMIDVKRQRLQYVYEQKQAQKIKEAIPNPVSLLSAASSLNAKRFVLSAVYMAVDSFSSYKSYSAEIDSEYMQDGWELDDEEAGNIHDSRKTAFKYMIETVQADDLPGRLALNETAVKDFVDNKNNDNAYSRLQFLEDEKETYEAFGNYWLELAKCHYELGEYDKCLEDIDTYGGLQPNIFRKDYELAYALPQAIIAASELLDAKSITEDAYIERTEEYLKQIYQNTERSEWTVRYFVAEMYVDLFARTNDTTYLDEAYSIIRENINYLINKQKDENHVYLENVKEIPIPKAPTKEQKRDNKATAQAMEDEKKRAENYNETLAAVRKTALAPIYEPLVINCDMLFAIADKLELTVEEKTKIDGILKDAFLTEPIAEHYKFNKSSIELPEDKIEYDKDSFTVPAGLVPDGSVIKVTVTDSGNTTVYEDWIIKEVHRPDNDFASFQVMFTSKDAKKQKWNDGATVKVEIVDDAHKEVRPVVLNFVASKNKKYVVMSEVVFTLVA